MEMRDAAGRRVTRWHRARGVLGLLGAVAVVLLAVLLAGCGAAGGASQAAGTAHSANSFNGSAGGQTSAGYNPAPAATAQVSGSSSSSSRQSASPGTYLIKSLEVDMAVADPRQTASDLRQWITSTDPRAQTQGMDYQRQDDGTYDVQTTFAVQQALYPQIQTYLANYAAGGTGRLLHIHENVQDVTNQYVDLQSQLINLRAEQQRLLTLMGQSNNLSDTLQIEQRLTDVEGQIQQIEGQQNQLNGQIAFYTITINLTPLSAPTGVPKPGPWSPGDVLQGAWNAAVTVAQVLATIVIWLGVFGIYIVPALLVIWGVRRWLRSRKPVPASH